LRRYIKVLSEKCMEDEIDAMMVEIVSGHRSLFFTVTI
jgi:hypothetical protein